MTLKTTWEWIKHTIKEDPVIFLLLLTIIIGYGYDFLPIPDGKIDHIGNNPHPEHKPHSYWWFGKFITIYLIHFTFEWALILKTKGLTREFCIVYFLIDFTGFLSYMYQGWPEPKFLFVITFFIGALIIISLNIWRLLRS